MLEAGLAVILLLVLFVPITIHLVEKNIELFLFFMGILSVSITHIFGNEPLWSISLIKEALIEPIMITAAVLIVGLLVYYFKSIITSFVIKLEHRLGSKMFCFMLITGLGILSSIITAIMASIILVEIISALRFDKKFELKLVILACFSIGLGAALTPIGEPLSTICIAKLKGEPYNADFFFLLKNLGIYIIPGIVLIGIVGAIIEPSTKEEIDKGGFSSKSENIKDIFFASGKVYVFIIGLVFLGAGFKPIVDKYIIKLPSHSLYWINSLSAVMDNATLAAAEISPKMSLAQLKYILMGLLIAGGMLIPGNIPNIISAGRLNIKSKEWAKTGIPLGFLLMTAYFLIFTFV